MKPTAKRYDSKTGTTTEVELTPAQLAKQQEELSRRFSKEGKDRLFPRMLAFSRPQPKRRLQRAA